ncbi:DUF4279 domain-containing protein [Pseudomonas lurida]|uniref:DUF4279 domain-containing protein n=1 Tax=Pseudomonas lurida TaxID=244566 RepID=UPI001FD5A75E|nr:DUF4279 domain-containing protein [Pseudomonas lurida]
MSKNSRITPVSSDYETCAECYVRLMIYPGERHPDEITNIMKVRPTLINVAGEKVTNSRGLTREVKNSGWFFSTEGYVLSKDLREHIDWIVEKISPHRESLRTVQKIDGVKITLKCVWFSLLGHSGPVLWPEQMRALADLDLECSFDVYFVES